MSMSRIESTLTRLEARLRQLIEGEPAAEGIAPKFHHQLEQGLTEALKACAHKLPDGQDPGRMVIVAPDEYTLVLPIEQAQLLLTHPAELDRLAHKLEIAAAQRGLVFTAAPVLRVVSDPQSSTLKVVAEFSQAGVEDSCTTEVEGTQDIAEKSSVGSKPKAFLIINGLTTFLLTEPMINIGRDPSNQVHLNDLRVSRLHAQLRLIQGRFVIFDLDSLGGTFVNEVAVSRHVLNPGDVINLAGVPLVYGQEVTGQVGYTQELPVEPPTPEVL
jgi:hypothetical protein